ncbi:MULTISPECIES: hypothetical protein [unclassified Candidatus Frackibacter]|uniref:hypothetical protein n=1 Tax=unclassified Candidatus Frackibacter TaxID=2648818 RepID=UPI00079228EC|nr:MULTISPECIES: hypothetical protein [unclassified Candidatus Frackibacter]KXS43255.1 MAG: hypothetical protein AWU54_1081 [Candidatus Frackibacter sp. T328-2]SDC87802.1 hypothetical protein SAMN04515661_13510 [Candidatus Frackibacter sp. WG11]SEN01931.1 hypothetical protein SAMN04488698_13710 [Candidatus Frackibacter sp. WG12]SFM10046.1 hypothetical protein SAMN04488699_1374 [Candidatus Frackibacter sp. WG13]
MFKQIEQHMKFGGMKVKNEVPIEEINDFILSLPDEKRDSWAEVTQILEDKGMISMEGGNEYSTIDDELLDAQVEENRRI